jgi:anti-sigma regulatory factor (Ser/Thr protein kinase)
MLIKTMPARLDSLHELMAFINVLAQKKGFSRETLNRIELVVEEALVNVFMHAYPSSPGDVEVCYPGIDEPALKIEIRDHGIFFDPFTMAEPDVQAGLADRKIGGMGVLLIRKMADQVAYRRDKDTNILTLTFLNR